MTLTSEQLGAVSVSGQVNTKGEKEKYGQKWKLECLRRRLLEPVLWENI